MAQFTGKSTRTFEPDAQSPQRVTSVGYSYTVARDGNVSGTQRSIGCVPAGAHCGTSIGCRLGPTCAISRLAKRTNWTP